MQKHMHFTEFSSALLCRVDLPSYLVLLIENFVHAATVKPKLAPTFKALCKQLAYQLGDCDMLDRLTNQGMDK